MESGRLNQEKRYLIHVCRHAGLSMRGIARMIGRAPSTISRELRRHDPQQAHRKSRQRRSRASQRPQINSACIARIQALLAEDLSPEQIIGTLGLRGMNGSIGYYDHGSSPRARGTRDVSVRRPARGRFIPACAGNTMRPALSARPNTVHPRVRGEHRMAQWADVLFAGSSPRVRGTHGAGVRGRTGRRFIPACAGNTTVAPHNPTPEAVHPRVRGEHSAGRPRAAGIGGSSPRARGTRTHAGGPRHGGRFIPACAGNTRSISACASSGSVHPRVRGEHEQLARIPKQPFGSSPRARGTRHRFGGRVRLRRFIPACAGNTGSPQHCSGRRAVHPRVRGEHFFVVKVSSLSGGSSPRARGTPLERDLALLRARFIPACAGNTACCDRRRGAAPVHPRVRGEHVTRQRSRQWCVGSSPRARGTPGLPGSGKTLSRFIPACAGNTPTTRRADAGAPVHPRVRGEHRNARPVRPLRSGSSPRARGTPGGRLSPVARLRFIPACAGNTPAISAMSAMCSVHPRVRGEHLTPELCGTLDRGSSPRARGTRRSAFASQRRTRFIPACAGNTCSWRPAPRARSVHPRVRGEHCIRLKRNGAFVGSSPRARGTPIRSGSPTAPRRFIPACAGNTMYSGSELLDRPVHPRVRGEHAVGVPEEVAAHGSSPRARGTPAASRPTGRRPRFIPACAGNTTVLAIVVR